MKTIVYFFIAVTLGLLLTATASVKPVSAQFDFNAFLGTPIDDSKIDGTIGNEWNDAGNYTNVAINPQGKAQVWTKHDGTYLYVAIRFTADSNNPWAAIMFGSGEHMTVNADGALFGHDEFAANGYEDIYFGGVGIIHGDTSQDGKGAITVDSARLVSVELKKHLSSVDSAGKDIAWTEGNTYRMVIMWDSNGYGSDGGAVNHSMGEPTGKNILINSSAIPEFPGVILIAVLIVITISAALLNRKMKAKSVISSFGV